MKIEDIHISGSEVAAILGLSKWETPMGIYMRKLGMTEPQEENEPMRWGTAAEHVVARRYAKQMGYNLFPSIDEGYDRHNPLIHPKYPWWTGTPDRKIIQGDQTIGLLEIKIIGERSATYGWGEPPDGEIPDSYACQCAWYMPLLGVEWADLAVQIGNREFRIYRINRDRELENQMRDAALEFINNHLLPEIPPAIDGTERSSMYLARTYPKDEEPLMETADQGIINLAQSLRGAKAELSRVESEIALYENRLKEYIGPHAGIQGSFGKVLWKKSKDGEKTDWKAAFAMLRESYVISQNSESDRKSAQDRAEDIQEEHTTIKPGARVFRPYLKGDE